MIFAAAIPVAALVAAIILHVARRHVRRDKAERAAAMRRIIDIRDRIAETENDVRAGVRPHGGRFTLHRQPPASGKATHVSHIDERTENRG